MASCRCALPDSSRWQQPLLSLSQPLTSSRRLVPTLGFVAVWSGKCSILAECHCHRSEIKTPKDVRGCHDVEHALIHHGEDLTPRATSSSWPTCSAPTRTRVAARYGLLSGEGPLRPRRLGEDYTQADEGAAHVLEALHVLGGVVLFGALSAGRPVAYPPQRRRGG